MSGGGLAIVVKSGDAGAGASSKSVKVMMDGGYPRLFLFLWQ